MILKKKNYNKIFNGVLSGLNACNGSTGFKFIDHNMPQSKYNYDYESVQSLKCVTNVMVDLIDRGVNFKYYAPFSIGRGKIVEVDEYRMEFSSYWCIDNNNSNTILKSKSYLNFWNKKDNTIIRKNIKYMPCFNITHNYLTVDEIYHNPIKFVDYCGKL